MSDIHTLLERGKHVRRRGNLFGPRAKATGQDCLSFGKMLQKAEADPAARNPAFTRCQPPVGAKELDLIASSGDFDVERQTTWEMSDEAL